MQKIQVGNFKTCSSNFESEVISGFIKWILLAGRMLIETALELN